jgi:hypothetical protein
MSRASVDDVLAALRDADFPATKQDLILTAQAAGAPDEVIAALRAIPPEEYRNRAEVARSVPVDPPPGTSPGQRAQQARQARQHGPRPLSQYQRDAPQPVVEDELEE